MVTPITIYSAEEFVRLRSSQIREEYTSAAWAEASDEVWLDTINGYPDYARWVAHNKSISVNIIRMLAEHSDADIRDFIAAKRKTPPEILWILAKDDAESVRHSVVFNAKTPKEILEHLTNDLVEGIRQSAQKKLSERKG
jgi:hypothetical protein